MNMEIQDKMNNIKPVMTPENVNDIKQAMAQETIENTKTVSELKQIYAEKLIADGDLLRGEIVDINNNTMKIITKDGITINGKLPNNSQLNIGENRDFVVSIKNGKLAIVLVDKPIEEKESEFLKKELKDLGLSANDNQIKVAKSLIDNNQPINKQTMAVVQRVMSMLDGDSKAIDKAMFVLKNDMQPTTKNIQILNNILNGDDITKQLQNVQGKIQQLPIELKQMVENIMQNETVVKEQQTQPTQNAEVNPNVVVPEKNNTAVIENIVKPNVEILDTSVNGKLLEEVVVEKLANGIIDNVVDDEAFVKKDFLDDIIKNGFKFNDKNNNELDKFIEETIEKINKTVEVLKSSDNPVSVEVKDSLVNVKEKLEFFQNMKENVFVQLPISLNEKSKNGEIIVFKDKRKKSSKNGSASALISIDTVNMGKFETYIQKNSNNVNMQFRINSKEIEILIKQNINRLNDLLQSSGYSLAGYSFKDIEESFSILDNEPSVVNEELERSANRITFDIRG